ncbi:unnamed protein product [Euphydryas editha]|uniref:Mariner Mos1 transposase n=1 Tax=Euphydryas editha TaxID=104508 RepID=A0AAU9V651_EUPED|nr:unnamed protein product [Euphydryas editha]
MLERNAAVNKELYIAQLHRVKEAIRLTDSKSSKKVLQHPTYTQGLAATDYHLFRFLSKHMRSVSFDREEDLKNWLNYFFDTRPGDFWQNGIEILVERWEEFVNSNGECVIDLIYCYRY